MSTTNEARLAADVRESPVVDLVISNLANLNPDMVFPHVHMETEFFVLSRENQGDADFYELISEVVEISADS